MDSGAIGVRAFLEGDDYVLDGEANFEGVGSSPDYFWTIAVTDPDMPANKCSGAFLVPASADGINIQTSDTLVPGEVHHVQFNKVWIPTNCLMGEEGNGWSLMQSTLLEDQVAEYPLGHDEDVAGLIQYASETNRYGMAISKHPFFQQLLMEVYVNSERIRVLRIRNAWMAETGQTLTYHTAQVSLMEKQASLRLSQVVREIMGIYAMLGPADPLAPMGGKYNLHQKRSLVQQNPTEGPEVQAAAIAKHLGLDTLEGKGVAQASPRTATGVSLSQ
jgi:alkylation response protein AidB-like acyl-CoA dehydrogenase